MSGYLWTAADAAAATSGTACGDWQGVTGLSIDTRGIAPGELFVALAGENRDGHDFVAQALGAGAGAAIRSARFPVACRIASERIEAAGGAIVSREEIAVLDCGRLPVECEARPGDTLGAVLFEPADFDVVLF